LNLAEALANPATMPRNLPELDRQVKFTNEQCNSQRAHAMYPLAPQLPASFKARKKLLQNLETMGFGNRFLSFPWSITSLRLVDELTTLREVPAELQGNAYQGELRPITQELIASIYGMRNEGDERPRRLDNKLHKKHFNVRKDSTDGYPIAACMIKELWDIFGYVCPILDPTQPSKVHIYRFNQVYLLLYTATKVN
jgi:hypothetical protein